MAVGGDRHLGVVRILDDWVRQSIAHAGAHEVDVHGVGGQRLVVLPDGVCHRRDIVTRVRLTEGKERQRCVLRVRLRKK